MESAGNPLLNVGLGSVRGRAAPNMDHPDLVWSMYQVFIKQEISKSKGIIFLTSVRKPIYLWRANESGKRHQ